MTPEDPKDTNLTNDDQAAWDELKDVFQDELSEGKPLRKGRILLIVRRTLLSLVTLILAVILLIYTVCAVVCYGPSPAARNLFVNSMLETSAMKFMPRLYFSKARVQELADQNQVIPPDDVSDPGLIQIPTASPEHPDDDPTSSASTPTPTPTPTASQNISEYIKISEENGILLYEVKKPRYNGNLMIIQDPSRVFVGKSHSSYTESSPGITVPQIAKNYNAVAAINGGGFMDEGGRGSGWAPSGMVITDGKLDWVADKNKKYDLVGFNKDNILVVGQMTAHEALQMGIRDAISFGPTLIMNGKKSQMFGSGSGVNPRTAIGQCRDGSVLLLVINGRRASSLGATYDDLAEILLDFGAVNASNLDGGTSTVMWYKGEIVNNIWNLRNMPTAIIVK